MPRSVSEKEKGAKRSEKNVGSERRKPLKEDGGVNKVKRVKNAAFGV